MPVKSTDQHANKSSKFFSDVCIRGLAEVFAKLRGLIFIPVIAKQLGATDFGIWAQITTLATFLVPILTARLETASVRYLSGEDDRAKIGRMVGTMMIFQCGILGFFLLFGLSLKEKIVPLIFEETISPIYVVLLCVLVAVKAPSHLLQYLYRALGKIKLFSVIEVVNYLFQIGFVALFLLYFNLGLVSAILSMILAEFIAFVIMIVHIHSFVPVRYVWEWKELRRYLKYSIPLIPNNFFAWVTNLSDRLVIVWYVGMAAVGVYSTTYLFGWILSAIYIPISFALFPAITEAWMHEDTETIKKYITHSLFYYLIVAVPAAVLMVATSPYLLQLLAGREFVTSPWLVIFIVVGLVMLGLYNIILYVIHLYERTVILPFVFALVALINFSGNLILVPNMGILGAGIMALISYATQLILIIFVSKYISKKNLIIWPSVWKIFLSCTPLILLFYLPSPKTMGQMLCLVISSLVCYALLLYMFGAIGRKEWVLVRNSLFRHSVS